MEGVGGGGWGGVRGGGGGECKLNTNFKYELNVFNGTMAYFWHHKAR